MAKTIKEITELLDQEIDPNIVAVNSYDGNRYIKGYEAINNANRIFGYGNWGYTLKGIKEHGDGLYEARVEVKVVMDNDDNTPEHFVVNTTVREDVGVCVAARSKTTNEISNQSRETAMKGAVTDALKRALRSFGNQFGNSLYGDDSSFNKPQGQSYAAPPRTQAPAQTAGRGAQNTNGSKSQYRLQGEANSDPSFQLEHVPATPPPCPNCGGEMWDQIASKWWGNGLGQSGRKKPVFKCKDKTCNGIFWDEQFGEGAQKEVQQAYQSQEGPVENPDDSDPFEDEAYADESMIVDMRKEAYDRWGDGGERVLKDMSLKASGSADYQMLSASQANKILAEIRSV